MLAPIHDAPVEIQPKPPTYLSRLKDALRGKDTRPSLTSEERAQLKKDYAMWDDLTASKDQFSLIVKGERREAFRRLMALLKTMLD
jgi:hypothetical protein